MMWAADYGKEPSMKKRIFVVISVLIVLVFVLTCSTQNTFAASSSSQLSPLSITTLKGATGGEPVTALSIQDQSGTQDTPTHYVSFTTPGVVYSGYRTYQLSGGISPASIIGFQISVNYKGPLKKLQRWTWSLYNWSKKTWTLVGDNASVKNSTTWTLLTFNKTKVQQFIDPSGNIQLLLKSNNTNGFAELDYESIAAIYTASSGNMSPVPCQMFPSDNYWNAPIDSLAVDSHSDAWISSIGSNTGFHMDFGSGTWDNGPIGIPYNLAQSNTPKYTVSFYYPDESDTGPYPIPVNPFIEYGSDHHLLAVDTSTCTLYEMYDVTRHSNGTWSGGSGAIWDLNSDALRPADWTSADAAGLPMLPGLVRYDEVASGQINHALRFTANSTDSYIWPARHLTSGTAGVITNVPPMGARFRLKASFDISGYPADMQVILQAMKTYGIVLADNGSDWYVSGVPDSRWNNDELHLLDNVTGADFEAVDTSVMMVDPNSGAVK
jgi:hypothetical protein